MTTTISTRALLGLAALCAANLASAHCVQEDQPFVYPALGASNLEIRMSEVASLRANSDAVRQFARAMIDEHRRARRELKELALSRDIKICEGLTLPEAHVVSALYRYIGVEFDREYLTQQIDQHRRALRLYAGHALGSPDGGMREYAASKVAVLEAHLRTAQSLAENR
jgi:putative membrane protein